MTYHPGQRVALVHTTDPHTLLRPGDQGTCAATTPTQQTVDVDWDNGSHLSMCLDACDRIQILGETPTQDQAAPAGDRWRQTVVAIRAAGTLAGRNVADWWGQDTIGGRSSGDVKTTARRILAGIDDGDPAVLDALPTLATSGTDAPSDADRYADAASEDALAWAQLTVRQRDDAIEAYRDGFDTAVTDRVTELCRIAASPTGDGRDLDHLHPRPGAHRQRRGVLRRLGLDHRARRDDARPGRVRRHPDRHLERLGGVHLHPAGRRGDRRRPAPLPRVLPPAPARLRRRRGGVGPAGQRAAVRSSTGRRRSVARSTAGGA